MFKKLYTLPLFQISFRPFFILSSLLAITVVTLWVSLDFNYIPFYNKFFTPVRWHGHEMVFGFSLALLSGFILTASSHWSGMPAAKGQPIFILSALWCLERIFAYTPVNFWVFFFATSLFLPYFIYLLHKQLGEDQKNKLIFIPIFFAYFITQKLYHLSLHFDRPLLTEVTIHWALNLTKLIIIIVSGRIIPFFSRAKLPNAKVRTFKWLEYLCIYSSLLLFIPYQWFRYPIFFISLNIFLLFIHSLRFTLWCPWKSLKIPMLTVLHSAQIWLLLVFALEALSYINPGIRYTQAPLHAFGAGALGVFAIAMMTRVSLGHTGRAIQCTNTMLASFFFVHLGAAIRVFIPIFTPELHKTSLHHSAGWWTLGFIFYLYEFLPKLLKKRPDGKD